MTHPHTTVPYGLSYQMCVCWVWTQLECSVFLRFVHILLLVLWSVVESWKEWIHPSRAFAKEGGCWPRSRMPWHSCRAELCRTCTLTWSFHPPAHSLSYVVCKRVSTSSVGGLVGHILQHISTVLGFCFIPFSWRCWVYTRVDLDQAVVRSMSHFRTWIVSPLVVYLAPVYAYIYASSFLSLSAWSR